MGGGGFKATKKRSLSLSECNTCVIVSAVQSLWDCHVQDRQKWSRTEREEADPNACENVGPRKGDKDSRGS